MREERRPHGRFYSRLSPVIALSLLLPGALVLLPGCYLFKQGGYILKHNREARPIESILDGGDLPDETRDFLRLVGEIKRYASEEIGLRQDRNYTTYVDIPRDYLVSVVSACRPASFEAYTWSFPVFGSFPYKGFFEREDALREARRLEAKGYDVIVRRVDAFSTLGFFTDPVYSFMADYSVFRIASLIIHEQTHATVYLKNRIQFNEEMATFVGNEGALSFIRDRYGRGSAVHLETLGLLEDFETFRTVIREIRAELEAVYAADTSRAHKLRAKRRIFRDAQRRFAERYDERFNTESFLAFKDAELNNAYIQLYGLYTQDLEVFRRLYAHNGCDLERTVADLATLRGVRGDPKDYIRDVLLR